jgi:alpha-mannosidase
MVRRNNVYEQRNWKQADIDTFCRDTEIYHLEKGRQVEKGSVQILEQGPLRVSLLIEKTISETSRLRQIVVITAISKRIDFETELDWNENRQFLVSYIDLLTS